MALFISWSPARVQPLRGMSTRGGAATATCNRCAPAGKVHERAVVAWRKMLEEAAQREEINLPFDMDRLACVLVRSGESMLYADLIGGREPDINIAAITPLAVLQAYDANPDGPT